MLARSLPHRALHILAKKYGPIMSLWLGRVPTTVISSPQAAELFLKTHGTIFASRPKLQVFEYLFYGAKGMAFTEYGSYWHNMRKLCALQLFSVSKIVICTYEEGGGRITGAVTEKGRGGA